MKQRIRLLLLIPHLGGGGAERVAAMLAQRLDPQLFDIHLVLISHDGPGAEAAPPWVTVHRLGLQRVRQSWLKLIRLIRAQRPDVILSSMAHLNFLLLLLKPLLPRKTRILIRQNSTASTAARNAIDRLLYRRLYPRADAVLCQSQAMADDLAAHFRIGKEKLVVLLKPIDIDRIRNQAQAANVDTEEKSIESHQHHLLTVARLSHEKGIDLLLDAISILSKNHPDITLSILGIGLEEAQLRRQCKQLHLESQVEFCGFASALGPHHARAQIFVLPSRHEGMPNALLDAAAAGLPIVATPCSAGVVELLRNQPGAWLATSISAESLAKSIAAALISLSGVRRFDHTFLAPFETKTSIAAYEALIARIATESQP
jgi:glycosyltransferase involved in cell wall biosynthesis